MSKEQSHPGAFETLAMVLAELGHFDLALDWQRLAMSAAARAGRPDVAQKMAANLARYVQRQPCRVPWRDDDPDHRPGPQVNPKLLDRQGTRASGPASWMDSDRGSEKSKNTCAPLVFSC